MAFRQRVGADQDRHPGEADEDAADARRGHPLVAGEGVGDENGKQRRRGVEDRGKAAGEGVLRPHDQAERDDVVEDAHAGECGPGAARPLAAGPAHADGGIEEHRTDGEARRDHGEGRQGGDGEHVEEERTAPHHRQGEQKRPFDGRHGAVDRG